MRITSEINRKIRLYMMDHQMSQADFAKLFGLRQTAINKWLNVSNVSLKEPNARKLCEILGLDYADEMYAQNKNSGMTVNVNGNNSGVAIQNNGGNMSRGYTLSEIIKAITESSDIDAETKVTVINVLSRIGLS